MLYKLLLQVRHTMRMEVHGDHTAAKEFNKRKRFYQHNHRVSNVTSADSCSDMDAVIFVKCELTRLGLDSDIIVMCSYFLGISDSRLSLFELIRSLASSTKTNSNCISPFHFLLLVFLHW